MSSTPLISFVVLCYNHERFIAECLRSIFAQQGSFDYEVVVVDDASTDGSVGVIEQLEDPRLRLIRHPQNQGPHATMTDGLLASRAPIVARIDGDDRYRPHFLRTTVPLFERHPAVGLAYGDAAMMGTDGEIHLEQMDTVHGSEDFVGNELVALMEENFICAPTLIARREAWLRALPIPPTLAFHDWWFTLQIARQYDFYFVAETLADYRVHPGNLHSHIAKDGREERSIFEVLDQIFAEVEEDPELERAKRRARKRIYSRHYQVLGDKYFWFRQSSAARRCYLQALRLRPHYLLDPKVGRRLLGTLVGQRRYEAVRDRLRSSLARRLSAQ